MAAHFDIEARIEKLGAKEVYISTPTKQIADIVALLKAGAWPIVLNVHGVPADQVPVIVTLSGWEAMQPRTGFEQADGDA